MIASGLDLAAALRRFGNNKICFASIARRFVTESVTMAADLNRSLRAGDRTAAAFLLHTLGGLAGTVGIESLAELSKGLEAESKTACGVTDPDRAMRRLLALLAEGNAALSAFIASVEPVTAPMPASPPPGGCKAAVATILDELDTRLTRADMGAVGVYSELQRRFGAELGDHLAPLADAVDRLDFKRALNETRALRESLQ
jgi:two-component system sensor histidine kinase/response regulator